MKITKLFLLCIAVILLSCGEDDDPKPTSDKLVGTWAITGLAYEGTTTTTAQGLSIESDFTGVGKDMDLTTTFSANPNTVTSEGSYIIVLTTSIMGQSTTQEITFYDVVTDGTWSLDGNTLTVTNADGPQSATIVEQSDSTLKLKIEVSDSQTIPGASVTTDIDATYTFKKQ